MNAISPTSPSLSDQAVEEAKQLIGAELRRPRPRKAVATKDAIIEYSRAMGSRNPLYTQETYASGIYYGSLVAHPTWLLCVDNTVVHPKLPGIHTIYAGATWEWYHPIRVNDRFTATAQLTDVQEKRGQFCGRMVLQTSEVVYRNQHGQTVARAIPRVLRTPREEAKVLGKYRDVERHRYSAEEITAIYKAYDDETTFGERPRYWEDQEGGEELPPIVRGPLTTEDINFFVTAVQGAMTFRQFHNHWRRHPSDAFIDPDTGMPDSWDISLHKDRVAREFGFPAAHDTGLQRVAFLESLVTNWMGDYSFLRYLDVRLTLPVIHGDTVWCHGTLIRKYRQGEEYLSDLELRCDNQCGETVATGSATVSLVSRDADSLPPILTSQGPLKLPA